MGSQICQPQSLLQKNFSTGIFNRFCKYFGTFFEENSSDWLLFMKASDFIFESSWKYYQAFARSFCRHTIDNF